MLLGGLWKMGLDDFIRDSRERLYQPLKLDRVPELDALYGVPSKDGEDPEVYVLDLSFLPTGTFKDFRNFHVLRGLLEFFPFSEHSSKIYLGTITSGNNGRSLDYWVDLANKEVGDRFRSVSIVDKSSSYSSVGDSSSVVRVNLSERELRLDEALEIMESIAQTRGEDATYFLTEQSIDFLRFGERANYWSLFEWEGSKISNLIRHFHVSSVYDYCLGLRWVFDHAFGLRSENIFPETKVFCPLGNGELMNSLWHLLKDRYLLDNSIYGKGFNDSSVVGVTVAGNPVAKALRGFPFEIGNFKFYRSGRREQVVDALRPFDLHFDDDIVNYVLGRIRGRGFIMKGQIPLGYPLSLSEFNYDVEDSVADMLVTPISPFMKVLFQTGHLQTHTLSWFLERNDLDVVSDEEILEEQRRLTSLGFDCEPSAVVGAASARFLRKHYELVQRLNERSELPIEITGGRDRLPRLSKYVPRIVIVNTGKGKLPSTAQ